MNYKEEAKYQLQAKLKEVGLSISEVKRQLNQFDASADVSAQDNQEFFDFFKSITKTPNSSTCSSYAANCTYFPDCNCKIPCKLPEEQSSQGSVTFVAGRVSSLAKVYVGDTLVNGVVKAMLEYDAERELPVLHLEILAPTVVAKS
jgi:hypothetical protein